MTDQIAGPLPQESNSQRIGRFAKKCFEANYPESWIPKELSGDEDYGFDYEIQTTLPGGAVSDIFRAQLKGSKAPALSENGEFFSVTLKATTIRYYARVTDPIMLVLCDLSPDEQPKNCPLYFFWIDEELRRANRSDIPEDQKSVNLRVPLSNRLDDNTDVSEYLKKFRDLNRVGETLYTVVGERYPSLLQSETVALTSKIPESFRSRSTALLDVMTQDASTAWPQAPVGTLPWLLQETSIKLGLGATEEAAELLALADQHLQDAKTLEITEYWFLKGRLHSFRLEDVKARYAFLEAAKASQNQPKHLVAWAEIELRLRYSLDRPNDFSDIITKLTGTDPLSTGMRARLIAAEGQYEEACRIADAIPGEDGWMVQAIIHTVQGASERALAACESGLAESGIRDSSRKLFLMLRARARFFLAIGKIDFKGVEAYVPISGPVGTNLAKLHEAWSDIVEAVESLRRAGWPPYIEYLADAWGAAASILGRQKDALPLLIEAGRSRPTSHSLQTALEIIASLCDDLDTALEANARLPDSDRKILQRVCMLHFAKRDKDCVDLFHSMEASLLSSHPQFGNALMFAALSADRIVRQDLGDAWMARLAAEPELAPQNALLEYSRVISKNFLAKPDALRRLEERHETLGRPFVTGVRLFHELDATDPGEAERCIKIAIEMQSVQMLHANAAIHLAQALITCGKWQDLLDLSNESLLRFDRDDRFLGLKAFALDKLGRSPEAVSNIRELIEKGKADRTALSIYVNIVARCGFIEQAVESVENILSSEVDKSVQIELLGLLFNLISISEPGGKRCVDIAWRIGQLTDPKDEGQEAFFLSTMFAATVPADTIIEGPKAVEFQQRLNDFMQRFPDSKIFKGIKIPPDASPDELLKAIRDAIGADDEQLRWREKATNQLQRGELPIPYAWRPRHVLNIPDLPTLWEIGKNSKSDQRQFHLTMALKDWQPVPRAAMRGHVPLLDLVSILVIHDLDLWDHLFRLFPKVAIGQATLIELQRLMAQLSGSPFHQKCREIQAALRARFEQITQPIGKPPEKNIHLNQPWALEEVKVLAGEGKFMIYSDDALFRLYCDPPSGGPPSICTLDILMALDEMCALSAAEAASKIATLCDWNVGVVIHSRYQIAILPDTLAAVRRASDGIEILRTSPLCNIMFSRIWDLEKPYSEIQGHAGALLRELCDVVRNPIKSVAALMGLWFGKARLHKNAPPPLRVIVQLIMQAARFGPPMSCECSHRLWNVLLELVEIESGDRMDKAKEREAAEFTGRVAAEIDQSHSLHGEMSMQQRLGLGLVSDTSESEAFNRGYTQFIQAKMKRPQ